jgi:HlyD family secretion protein
MIDFRMAKRRALLCLAAVAPALFGLTGCDKHDTGRLQGYVEGEYVYVASPRAGALEALEVGRGDQVEAGDELFRLESAKEQAARDEAQRRLEQARENLEDVRKGKRPTEIEALQAQLEEAAAALAFSGRDLARLEKLRPSGAATDADVDRARSRRDEDQARVLQLKAELKTAQLGARTDQIEAAEAEVAALEAALAQAQWNREQKQQPAPRAGLVFDTLFREGEWVPAGRPVVALLSPQNIKVRAFVPETEVAAIQVGDGVRVYVDGLSSPLAGKVSFISPRAEYTPPVIYSRESRSKLVVMIEVVFEPEMAAKLHPGQPVDVELGP